MEAGSMMPPTPAAILIEDPAALLAKMLSIPEKKYEYIQEAEAGFKFLFPDLHVLHKRIYRSGNDDEGELITYFLFRTQEEAAEFKLRYM